jgi:hypothetical protein
VIASRNSKTNEILKSLDKLIRADQVLDDMNARVRQPSQYEISSARTLQPILCDPWIF